VTASAGTDRPASGIEIGGKTHINESAYAAPVMSIDCYEDIFHESTTNWYGKEAIGRLKQDPLYITPEVFEWMYLTNKQV